MQNLIRLTMAACVALPLVWTQQAVAQQAAHPETQKVIFENDLVRVLEIHVPAGVFEPMHSHARGVTVAMADYENENKTADGKTGGSRTKRGDVRWAEPVTHEARNIGKTEQHVIRVELKKDAPPANPAKPGPLDATVVAKDSQTVLFENAYVRAIQDRSKAGEATPRHSHQRGLLINVTDYDIEVTGEDGKVTKSHQKKAGVAWSEPVTHRARVTGTAESWAVRVEIK